MKYNQTEGYILLSESSIIPYFGLGFLVLSTILGGVVLGIAGFSKEPMIGVGAGLVIGITLLFTHTSKSITFSSLDRNISIVKKYVVTGEKNVKYSYDDCDGIITYIHTDSTSDTKGNRSSQSNYILAITTKQGGEVELERVVVNRGGGLRINGVGLGGFGNNTSSIFDHAQKISHFTNIPYRDETGGNNISMDKVISTIQNIIK